jgi:SAM-dependent methyltransferase
MIEYLINKHLKNVRALRILDVGPGYQHFSRIAAAATGADSVTYMDINPSVLEWQVLECAKCGINAEPLQMDLDAAALSKIKESYDLILCQEVLEHLKECETVLAGLVARLNPGGHVLITVPTRFSERWLKLLNPAYMKDEPNGHMREFDKKAMLRLLNSAGLKPFIMLPTQPHYFISHTWLFGTRMKVEGATGRVVESGWRVRVLNRIQKLSRKFFMATGPEFWGYIFPRNYFVVAERRSDADSC